MVATTFEVAPEQKHGLAFCFSNPVQRVTGVQTDVRTTEQFKNFNIERENKAKMNVSWGVAHAEGQKS